MTYATEFPSLAEDPHCAEMARRADSWEDTSWHHDACPSFMCDVFVLWIDEADPLRREIENGSRFTMTDESETVLETDDWADVLAFIDDGRRDFPTSRIVRTR